MVVVNIRLWLAWASFGRLCSADTTDVIGASDVEPFDTTKRSAQV